MNARFASPTRAAALTRILAQVACFPELRFDARTVRSPRSASSTDTPQKTLANSHGEDSAGESIGGLATAIEQATLRHWLTAESIARVLCNRPWLEVQPEIRAALLVSITQILFMPREPDHAVVDDAVSWTRGRLQSGAGGFVNALLRRIVGLRGDCIPATEKFAWWEHADALPLPDGSVLKLNEPVLSSDPIARLSAQTSHPTALITRWSVARGMETARKFAVHGLLQMPIVVHDASGNTLASDHPVRKCATPHSVEGFFVWNDTTESLASILAQFPALLVQDPASARAIDGTRDLSPRRILDACAGRGTKAVQCAMRHPNAEVWATDPDPQRMASLRARAQGIANLKVVELAEIGTLPRHFDLVLLDVPCSNTGVLARRLEARYRFTERNLDELLRLQRGIGDHHRGLCASGGMILWSTCSMDRAENQDQAKWLAKQVGGKVGREDEWLPHGMPGDSQTTMTDASYHARILLP